MKSQLVNSRTSLHALLLPILLLFTPGSNSTFSKLHLGNKSFLSLTLFFFYMTLMRFFIFPTRYDVIVLWWVTFDPSRPTDEVIGDVVEKLFGAVVQDEFSELMDNCPDAYAALKVWFPLDISAVNLFLYIHPLNVLMMIDSNRANARACVFVSLGTSKKSGDCISNRNLSYQRFIRPSPDPSDVKQLCEYGILFHLTTEN